MQAGSQEGPPVKTLPRTTVTVWPAVACLAALTLSTGCVEVKPTESKPGTVAKSSKAGKSAAKSEARPDSRTPNGPIFGPPTDPDEPVASNGSADAPKTEPSDKAETPDKSDNPDKSAPDRPDNPDKSDGKPDGKTDGPKPPAVAVKTTSKPPATGEASPPRPPTLPSGAVRLLPDSEPSAPPVRTEPAADPSLAEPAAAPLTDKPADLIRRVEGLLSRRRVAASGKVPADKRLDYGKPADVRPGGAAEAWRSWRRAWLQDDAEAGYALLSPAARKRIAETLAEWRKRSEKEGAAKFLSYLSEGAGLPHHAAAIRRAGDIERYSVRAFFTAAWNAEHADPVRAAFHLNSWEVAADPDADGREGAATVRGRFVGPLVGDIRDFSVPAAVDPTEGTWRVDPGLR
jgi:hypothetical protein